jgi:hypothetical protein
MTLSFEDAPFAGVYLSSLEAQKSIEQADRLLLTVMARTANTGMKFNEERNELIALGEAPVRVEPVTVTIGAGRKIKAVNVLDHDGRRTNRTIEVGAGTVTLRGAETHAIYYELEME